MYRGGWRTFRFSRDSCHATTSFHARGQYNCERQDALAYFFVVSSRRKLQLLFFCLVLFGISLFFYTGHTRFFYVGILSWDRARSQGLILLSPIVAMVVLCFFAAVWSVSKSSRSLDVVALAMRLAVSSLGCSSTNATWKPAGWLLYFVCFTLLLITRGCVCVCGAGGGAVLGQCHTACRQ